MTVLNMDCIEGMRLFPDAYFDSIVTDPPYELTSARPGGRSPATEGKVMKGFMGMEWDGSGIAYNVEMWTEALRVLKPGGHLLAFSGSRTYHRMVCAIEDAGFEIRDQIMWVYGSGFPKSLDVSKAIDKAAGMERGTDAVSLRQRGTSGGFQVAVRCETCGLTRNGTSCKCPAPPAATDAARQWQGWGTALKPAHEPIVVARKPLTSLEINVLARVESELRARGVSGKITWKNAPANDAAKKSQTSFSSSIEAPPAVATSAKSADENVTPSSVPKNAIDSASGAVHGQLPIGSESPNLPSEVVKNYATTCSTTTVESAHAAVKASDLFSLSITLPAGALRTAAPHSARSTPSSDDSATPRATECFAGIATGLTGSMEIAHIEQTAPGLFLWPHGLPKKVEAKPLTVAANVLQFGTGAINVDGCRVGDEVRYNAPAGNVAGGNSLNMSAVGMPQDAQGRTAVGRWPANVIHNGSDEVLAAFPQTTTGGGQRNGAAKDGVFGDYAGNDAPRSFEANTGSAARFFYCAKASKSDRSDGNTHPTVKPTDLMRYLCRLVTPPGGTVLDPFTGSGSTGKAARLEGFGFIGFELSEEYTRIATARIAGVSAP